VKEFLKDKKCTLLALKQRQLFRNKIISGTPRKHLFLTALIPTPEAFVLFILVFETSGWHSSAELYKSHLGGSGLLKAESALPYQYTKSWSEKVFSVEIFCSPEGVKQTPIEFFCPKWR